MIASVDWTGLGAFVGAAIAAGFAAWSTRRLANTARGRERRMRRGKPNISDAIALLLEQDNARNARYGEVPAALKRIEEKLDQALNHERRQR